MKTRRINRYIFFETLTPTLLGLIVFTFILIMGRLPSLTELVVNKGVPLFSIFKLFSYLLPTFLSITIPLSFLLGILLAFGRLSSDGEFIALKSTGISLYTLLIPILSFSLVCVLITAGLTLFGEPFGKAAFRDQIFTMASNRASIGIQGGVFNDSFDDLVIYAETMDDKR
ncbi:MAG: LptF/LptG family permease, partial [Geopsychrobacter sp.]|nr:LptF/LptG family permease [Geopsychrobacter sp.]